MDDLVSIDDIGRDCPERNRKLIEIKGSGNFGKEETEQLQNPLITNDRRSLSDRRSGETDIKDGVSRSHKRPINKTTLFRYRLAEQPDDI